ncbi:Sister chromatid cohesion protein DCC1 [Euphorbia peplus]|nr:Sister chromatid cohesion protein DCC1 [Euphorbia peplus]
MEQADFGCGGAQAVLNLQPSSSIPVAYHPSFGIHDDLLLLELDEKLLPDVFHQRVTLRGQPDEDAVLCTQSKTYAIKFVGTSNSAFLIPQSDHFILDSQDCQDKVHDQQHLAAHVLKVAPGNMELVEVSPKLDKLKFLLSENPYNSESETDEKGLYTWDDLVNRIQASNDELRSGLQALSAVEIDGYWRTVDHKYMDTILRNILQKSLWKNWSLGALNEDEVVRALENDEIPEKLGRHCLNVYGTKVDRGIDTNCLWKLEERRVCVHFARELLRTGKKKLENFKEEWSQEIPYGMEASFEMLEGEVLTEKLGVETWVRAFSVTSLPSTPAERFDILFRERAKWEWTDLLPYIRDLKVPGLSSEALLLKYTRRTQPKLDAEPVFSAR